jgi:phosphatidylglycerophosphate synthase
MTDRAEGRDGPDAWLLGQCDVRLWGLDAAERWRRWLGRAGVDVRRDEKGLSESAGHVLLVRIDAVLEESVVKALVASPGTVLVLPAAGPAPVPVAAHVPAAAASMVADMLRAGRCEPGELSALHLASAEPAQLGSSYHHALRKRAPPFAALVTAETALQVERGMFAASYKGVTDLVTKWLWPAPAFWATRWAAGRRITPNVVTWVSLAFVVLAWWLFREGHYAAGLAAAWLMTFLDTVDGKLARVTATSSRLGDVLDHGIDLLHPPFWYVAWWQGLTDAGAASALALWIVVGGYVLGRVVEGWFIWRFRIEIHTWRRIDSWARLITARRNANLILLTLAVLAGRPALGLAAVAVWTLLSLGFHLVRVAQAEAARRRGEPPRSWLAEPARAA